MRRSFLLLLAAGLLGGARAAATKRRNMLFFIAECAHFPAASSAGSAFPAAGLLRSALRWPSR